MDPDRRMTFLLERLASPIGTILLLSDGEAVRALDFSDHEARMHTLLRRQYGRYEVIDAPRPSGIGNALDAYFAGDLARLDDVAIRTAGTEFQLAVWSALRRIPAASTTTYGALAARLGRPGSSRAVGLANGANPIAIIVPCHRVVGADQSLTGYGGGLARKAWLLAHEQGRLI